MKVKTILFIIIFTSIFQIKIQSACHFSCLKCNDDNYYSCNQCNKNRIFVSWKQQNGYCECNENDLSSAQNGCDRGIPLYFYILTIIFWVILSANTAVCLFAYLRKMRGAILINFIDFAQTIGLIFIINQFELLGNNRFFILPLFYFNFSSYFSINYSQSGQLNDILQIQNSNSNQLNQYFKLNSLWKQVSLAQNAIYLYIIIILSVIFYFFSKIIIKRNLINIENQRRENINNFPFIIFYLSIYELILYHYLQIFDFNSHQSDLYIFIVGCVIGFIFLVILTIQVKKIHQVNEFSIFDQIDQKQIIFRRAFTIHQIFRKSINIIIILVFYLYSTKLILIILAGLQFYYFLFFLYLRPFNKQAQYYNFIIYFSRFQEGIIFLEFYFLNSFDANNLQQIDILAFAIFITIVVFGIIQLIINCLATFCKWQEIVQSDHQNDEIIVKNENVVDSLNEKDKKIVKINQITIDINNKQMIILEDPLNQDIKDEKQQQIINSSKYLIDDIKIQAGNNNKQQSQNSNRNIHNNKVNKFQNDVFEFEDKSQEFNNPNKNEKVRNDLQIIKNQKIQIKQEKSIDNSQNEIDIDFNKQVFQKVKQRINYTNDDILQIKHINQQKIENNKLIVNDKQNSEKNSERGQYRQQRRVSSVQQQNKQYNTEKNNQQKNDNKFSHKNPLSFDLPEENEYFNAKLQQKTPINDEQIEIHNRIQQEIWNFQNKDLIEIKENLSRVQQNMAKLPPKPKKNSKILLKNQILNENFDDSQDSNQQQQQQQQQEINNMQIQNSKQNAFNQIFGAQEQKKQYFESINDLEDKNKINNILTYSNWMRGKLENEDDKKKFE